MTKDEPTKREPGSADRIAEDFAKRVLAGWDEAGWKVARGMLEHVAAGKLRVMKTDE